MIVSRRSILAGCAGLIPSLSSLRTSGTTLEAVEIQPLGIVHESFGIRRSASRASAAPEGERFDDPLVFLDFCHALGARGVQVAIGTRDESYAKRLRLRAEEQGMYLEGTIRLPRDRADVDRFSAEVRTAKLAGARILRTVMLSGRRYEAFPTRESFQRFATGSYESLSLAEPVVSRHATRLAVENHKDWLAGQLVGILKRLGSEHVGVCLDTGNNLALLEDPMDVVEALAPWSFTTHIKDMGVREYEQGFLLSEVPLGEGFLDLPRIVRVLRAARPGIHLNLEMITRDPLKVPCLDPSYWATFEERPGRDLARMLSLVRRHASKGPLAEVAGLPLETRLRREEENVRRSFSFASEKLREE